MKLRTWLFLLFLPMVHILSAQVGDSWSTGRSILVPPGVDSVFLDTMPVLENSIVIHSSDGNLQMPNFAFTNSPVSYLLLNEPSCDSLQISFSIIPLPLNKHFSHKDTSLIIPNLDVEPEDLYQSEDQQSFEPFAGLNSNGSISRGVSVGNNQNAVLNSSLNLQLSGDIGQNTKIKASISDNNLPVQADGYTQQLREFDRVYIELENKDFGLLRAGDYNMSSTDDYFLNFDKRISGAGIFTKIPLSDNNMPLQLQGGIARGKFARNRFQGQEGNQGPYKLTGNSNEQFIIIISGSERVYIDGVLMKRGQQNDYVIDYNAGEITFTALRPITKDSRIVVEFQYTQQNYLRSVVFGQTGFESEKFKTSVALYSEQDSKNQPILEDITDNQKAVLSRAGDDLSKARISTISPSAFKNDQVLYRLTDSLGTDSVLVYSTDSTSQLYQATFTYLGANKGDYILEQSNANGRVFRWVPRINGISQGAYSPVKQLVAPTQLQVLSVKSEGQIGKGQTLSINLAGSKNDQNLFSNLDEDNDKGVAGKINYSWQKKLGKNQLNTAVNYEFNDANFTTVERIRNVEFDRDWNLPVNYSSSLSLGGVSLELANDSGHIGVSSNFLNLPGYAGVRNGINAGLVNSTDLAAFNGSWLTTTDSIGSTDFFREGGFITHYLVPKVWVGLSSAGELNKRKATTSDTLQRASYNFLQYQLYVGFGDTTGNYTEVNYLQRFDDTARYGRFRQFSKAISYGFKSQYKTNFNSTLQAQVNIRSLKVLEPVEKELQRTVTSRGNYIQQLFSNTITSSTFYESGSGTEPRRSYSYLEVPAGTGTYTFTDYNGDGIQQLDEFEVAPTPDQARYVRVYTASTDYVRTGLLKFGENLNINAPFAWQNKDDLRKTLSRFSLLFNYQLDRKTLLNGTINKLNPFAKIENDSDIVSLNNNFRSTLFFNRSSTKFGMDYTYRKTDNRNLLSFGVEQRIQNENTLNLRYQVLEALLFKTKGSLINKRNISSNFSKRNFSIGQWQNNYSLSYQTGRALVLTGRYELNSEQAMADQESQLFGQTIGADIAYNMADKINLQLSINYVKNDFKGIASSPAGFEMLQGLQPGNNGTWNLTLQRTIRKNILLSLNYSGRVSPDITPIHTGNVEIKAFF